MGKVGDQSCLPVGFDVGEFAGGSRPDPTEKIWRNRLSGCSSAWLERCAWAAEVAGSNPVTLTNITGEMK